METLCRYLLRCQWILDILARDPIHAPNLWRMLARAQALRSSGNAHPKRVRELERFIERLRKALDKAGSRIHA